MTGRRLSALERAALLLALAAAGVAAAALARELVGAGVGALRLAFVALAAPATVVCLLASVRGDGRRDRGATLAALGATLGACATVALGRELDTAPWPALLDAGAIGLVGGVLLWRALTRRRS